MVGLFPCSPEARGCGFPFLPKHLGSEQGCSPAGTCSAWALQPIRGSLCNATYFLWHQIMQFLSRRMQSPGRTQEHFSRSKNTFCRVEAAFLCVVLKIRRYVRRLFPSRRLAGLPGGAGRALPATGEVSLHSREAG